MLELDTVEQPAHQCEHEQQYAQKTQQQLPAHDLLEHEHFRQAGGHSVHAEGHGGAQGKALEQQTFHDGNDAGHIGVERNAHRHDRRNGPPLPRVQIFGKPLLRHVAVQGRTQSHTSHHPQPDPAEDARHFSPGKGMALAQARSALEGS